MKKKQPYNNTVSNYFFFAVILAIIISLSSCAGVKKDCRGTKHYKTAGGFYI